MSSERKILVNQLAWLNSLMIMQGISIDDSPAKDAPEKFVAAKYSSGKVSIIHNFDVICLLFVYGYCLAFFCL